MRLCIAHGGDLSDPSGGTDRVSALAAGLEERGHDVVVVAPAPAGELNDRLRGVDIREVDPIVDNAVGRALSVSRRAVSIARTEHRQLEFEHSVLGGVASLFTRDEPFVLDMHDLAYSRYDHVDSRFSPVLSRVVERIERRAVKNASQVALVSETMAEMVCSRWNTPREKLSVVPNGYFADIAEQFEDIETVPGRIAFLGTLHPKVDVEALCGGAELDEVSELLVIGDGAQRERLETESKHREALRVLGRLPDDEAFRYVASAAVVVNPQIPSALQRSSSPVKLYYYAALAKPIVATEGPDILRELSNEDAALSITDRTAFVTALQNVLRDDDLAQRLGTNAASVAREHEWSVRIKPLIEIHQRVHA